jgi:hypothetical protein
VHVDLLHDDGHAVELAERLTARRPPSIRPELGRIFARAQ